MASPDDVADQDDHANDTSPDDVNDQDGHTEGDAVTEFEGVVEAINGNQLVINGQTVIVTNATEFDDDLQQLQAGSTVKVKVIDNGDGTFTLVEVDLASPDDVADQADHTDNADDSLDDTTQDHVNDDDASSDDISDHNDDSSSTDDSNHNNDDENHEEDDD